MMGLSIIVCSNDSKKLNSFTLSLEGTIGDIDYELIAIDNKVNNLAITKVYNKGATNTKFKNLLFVHEDVIFHSQNWGIKLINELEDKNCGVLGIAGSSYVPYAPLGFVNPNKKYNYFHLLQFVGSKSILIEKLPEKNEKIKALDGVFLAVRKDIWNEVKFNERLSGFHAYDLDFSLRISLKWENRIIKDLLLEHKSLGSITKQYLENIIKVKREIKIVNTVNDSENEYASYREFVTLMKILDFSFRSYFQNGIYFLSLKKLDFYNYLKAFVFLFKIFFDPRIEKKSHFTAVSSK